MAYLENWELKATERAIEALQLSFNLERQAYGNKSFAKGKAKEGPDLT